MPFRPLTPDEVREFEGLTRVQNHGEDQVPGKGRKRIQSQNQSQGQDRTRDKPYDKKGAPMNLTDKLKRKAKAILDALSPEGLSEAAGKVADRWIAGLAPLEPVLVRKPPATRAPRRGR
jgi:hypothetical protein